MTFTEGFTPEEEQEIREPEDYPTAFGITFTPLVSGIALGLLGLLVGLYVIFTWGIPVYQKLSELKAEERSKKEQIERQKSGTIDRRIQRLERQLQEAENANLKVQSLFASEQSAATLLFDINKIANQHQVKVLNFQLRKEKKGREAEETEATIVDSSLGKEANRKLKRQRIDLEIAGKFENTQKFLRSLELLQTLVAIKDVNISLNPEQLEAIYLDRNRNVATPSTNFDNINTAMLLETIIPLTPDELSKAKVETEEEEEGEETKGKKDKKEKKNTEEKAAGGKEEEK